MYCSAQPCTGLSMLAEQVKVTFRGNSMPRLHSKKELTRVGMVNCVPCVRSQLSPLMAMTLLRSPPVLFGLL